MLLSKVHKHRRDDDLYRAVHVANLSRAAKNLREDVVRPELSLRLRVEMTNASLLDDQKRLAAERVAQDPGLAELSTEVMRMMEDLARQRRDSIEASITMLGLANSAL